MRSMQSSMSNSQQKTPTPNLNSAVYTFDRFQLIMSMVEASLASAPKKSQGTPKPSPGTLSGTLRIDLTNVCVGSFPADDTLLEKKLRTFLSDKVEYYEHLMQELRVRSLVSGSTGSGSDECIVGLSERRDSQHYLRQGSGGAVSALL